VCFLTVPNEPFLNKNVHFFTPSYLCQKNRKKQKKNTTDISPLLAVFLGQKKGVLAFFPPGWLEKSSYSTSSVRTGLPAEAV
jgi:hypothetical protein